MYKFYETDNTKSINIVSESESMLKKYLETRGIDKNTVLTSPMTGRTFSIERLVTTLENLGKAQTLVSTLEILPFRNDKKLLETYLSGIGESYVLRNVM